MSLMPVVISVKQAAALSTVFSLLATVTTFFRHFRDYKWRRGFLFLSCVILGVPAGVYFLNRSSESLLKRILGAVMVVLAAREFYIGCRKAREPQPDSTEEAVIDKYRRNEANSKEAGVSSFVTIPLGLFSGVLSGAFNLGGTPSAAYAYAHPWTRGQIMAFLQVVITLSSILRIVCYRKFGMLGDLSIASTLILLIPLYLSIALGHFVMKRIHPRHMRAGVFIFIAIAGIYYLAR